MPTNVKPPMFPVGASFPIPTTAAQRGTPVPDPVLHTTLLSAGAITSPIIGPAGTITGTPTYDVDGILIDVDSEYAEYTMGYGTEFTVEFTIRPLHDETYASKSCYLGNPSNINKVLFQFHPTLDEFWFWVGGASQIIARAPYTFSINEELTIRGVANSAGIDGGADIIRIYINGVLQGTNTNPLPSIAQTVIRIGNDWTNTCDAQAKMINLKIWDEEVLP